MSLQLTKEVVSSGIPIFQKVFETAQGGFTLDNTGLTKGSTIPAGAPIAYDESTRMAKVLKTGQVYENAGGSATAYKLKKGSLFNIGDYIGNVVGGKAYAITAIDTTGSNVYDTLTVGTSIGAVTAGDGVFQSSATGATSAALSVTPRGLLNEDVTISTDADLSVVVRGTVYERRAPGYTTGIKTLLPLIIFSQSF
ncbi:hypothetical protein SAMN05428988_0152 [Chitinophaga sp. YR573]|uniref:hypothetical protein n=1 Tax=Chitinophaga sp. YR573 TaxID=1881040 RepID=UPI0008D71D9E|nr:hypothetical protein [Chitinophaga sp. YR573]SEV88862.1 hypothetical protein SAMN05428988_0152 [Chitinophaga sp. YR573]